MNRSGLDIGAVIFVSKYYKWEKSSGEFNSAKMVRIRAVFMTKRV